MLLATKSDFLILVPLKDIKRMKITSIFILHVMSIKHINDSVTGGEQHESHIYIKHLLCDTESLKQISCFCAQVIRK